MSKLKAKWAEDFVSEVPAGTINGVNAVFTLSFAPVKIVRLEQNGRPLRLSTDYSVSGTTLTLVVPPAFGQEIDITYTK